MADSRTSYLSANDTYTVFKTEAFNFLNSGNAVYVECRILVCFTSDNSLDCRACPTKRKRRSITEESMEQKAVNVKSPIFFIIDSGGRNISMQPSYLLILNDILTVKKSFQTDSQKTKL